MSLNLMYITNNKIIASIAEKNGVDRIFIDMEYIGKEKRQEGMDTVKLRHTIDDVISIRKTITDSEILVRVNPIHSKSSYYEDSTDEINRVIDAGADIIMLPMYRTLQEVDKFVKLVDGRAKTILLTETPEACEIMDEVLDYKAIDELHIGLNDLHLAYHKKFMFELLADGTVDKICSKIRKSGKQFGFGGIARIGYGLLPAEYIISEHYRIGSTRAILSRAFCNIEKLQDVEKIEKIFQTEIIRIRNTEQVCSKFTDLQFEQIRKIVTVKVEEIISKM